MSNEKMFFDQFRELLNENEEPKKHEASHTNLKKYMETALVEDELEERRSKESYDRTHPNRGEVFDVYLGGKKVDTVFFKHFSAEEVKDSLVDQDGYSSDIEVKLVEGLKGEMGEEVTRGEKGDSLKAFDVYLDGTKIDTVFYKNFSAEEVKDSLIDHDGYSSDIEVVLDEGLKGDMGEEVTREEMGDSLKGYEEGDLYDIIKFLKGYKAETISDAIEKMKKWKLDSFNESKLSREMGLNEAQEAFHGSQKSGEYVGSKKVAGVEVDYYVKYKVAGKSKTVDRFEARFGKEKDDVLTVSGRALTKEDKLFGHLYNKFSDKIKKDNSKETPAMTKKREENYKEFEDATKDDKK